MVRTVAAVAAMLLVAGAGCSRHERCGGDADCPRLVSRGGRDYRVSCAVVPRDLVGSGVEVTDEDERSFGAAYGVDGWELEGIDPADAVAVRFAQEVCGDRAFHVAFADDLPGSRLREIARRLERR